MTADLGSPASALLWPRLIWTGHLALGILTESRLPFPSSNALPRTPRGGVRTVGGLAEGAGDPGAVGRGAGVTR